MSGAITLLSCGPGLTVQDLGRPGLASVGLSQGGAADPLALFEAAALLGLPAPAACLELAGSGARLRLSQDHRIALTGAPREARSDGRALRWNAAHELPAGAVIEIGAAVAGVYAYLSVAGGIATEPELGGRGAHLAGGIGGMLGPGTALPLGPDPAPGTAALALPLPDRFAGGTVRLIPGPQSRYFDAETRARFAATPFVIARANRQGATLDQDPPGAPFEAALAPAGLVSEPILPGDIQITGGGQAMVLLAECQTTGGYPRIGSVIPADLPRVAQAGPGTALQFRWITADEADLASPPEAQILRALRTAARPAIRDPHDIADLLGYQLISGMVRGDEQEDA